METITQRKRLELVLAEERQTIDVALLRPAELYRRLCRRLRAAGLEEAELPDQRTLRRVLRNR